MKYQFKTFTSSNFHLLKEEWIKLEKGEDMTYYQSYHWYESIMKFMPEKKGYYGSVFLCIYLGDQLQLICPLWVVYKTINFVNKRSVYILGRQGWSDYLNVIYDNCSTDAFLVLFNYIKDKWKIKSVCFEQLMEHSRFFKYISSNYSFRKDIVTTCVKLEIPESNDDYKKQLSKSSRQNIRTARNRLAKDGLSITFSFDAHPNLEQCKSMRAKRVIKKNEPKSFRDKLRQIKNEVYQRFTIEFPKYLPFYADSNSRMMTACIDGELAAFFNYSLDTNHRQVMLMAVGTNEKFSRYSPGVLLVFEYVTKQIESKEIQVLDFTRGNESYKYQLGGTDHLIHSIVFEI